VGHRERQTFAKLSRVPAAAAGRQVRAVRLQRFCVEEGAVGPSTQFQPWMWLNARLPVGKRKGCTATKSEPISQALL
jgi:hypothetical protein